MTERYRCSGCGGTVETAEVLTSHQEVCIPWLAFATRSLRQAVEIAANQRVALRARLAEAEAENERLREVLKQIARFDCLRQKWGRTCREGDFPTFCPTCLAAAALEGKA